MPFFKATIKVIDKKVIANNFKDCMNIPIRGFSAVSLTSALTNEHGSEDNSALDSE